MCIRDRDFIDLFDTMRMWSEAVPVSSVTYGWLALSVQPSGGISWDVSLGGNAYVTLTNPTCALTITNAVPGQVLMLKVKQDATGGRATVSYTHLDVYKRQVQVQGLTVRLPHQLRMPLTPI